LAIIDAIAQEKDPSRRSVITANPKVCRVCERTVAGEGAGAVVGSGCGNKKGECKQCVEGNVRKATMWVNSNAQLKSGEEWWYEK